MNIFDFINSKDIREHLMSLDYKFDSMEASWLVYQSGRHTLNEKIEAWNWIIDNMPDCVVKERMNCCYRDSLHKTLKAYMSLMKKYIQEFFESEDCVYTYGYYYVGDYDWSDSKEIFESSDACFDDLFDGFSEEEKVNFVDIRITRRSTLENKRKIEVAFNRDREIMSVNAYCETDEEAELTIEFFDGMWFAFPTPFKVGDAVIRYDENEYPPDRSEGGILILNGCTPEWLRDQEQNRIQRYIDGHSGDSSDMNVWGYFQDEDGRIYTEVTHNYMDFEFYRGPYEGKSRLMKAISSFKHDEIDLSMLLAAYRKVILDEFTKDIMLTNWFTDEGLELAGLSEVVEMKNKQRSK